ncbi:MAG: hypothetical protein M0020_00330 [Actinomycetota bacterium]|nr:hypothetical protein [Actinomycetota bacterium]
MRRPFLVTVRGMIWVAQMAALSASAGSGIWLRDGTTLAQTQWP